MPGKGYIAIVLGLVITMGKVQAQSWVDSLYRYGSEVVLPAEHYKWDWGEATFLNAVKHLYDVKPVAQKELYLTYIKTAMDKTFSIANGRYPNAIASAHGMAFLARVIGQKAYLEKSLEIYNQYLKIPRADNGGVSHRIETIELWDDSVYMLSMYLLEMYKLTLEIKYIDEFVKQIKAHSEKLADSKIGLWVHGWDGDTITYNDGCSMPNWSHTKTHRSHEFWGRGNGWIAMALADALQVIPANSIHYRVITKEFLSFCKNLPEWQDKNTGLWYQLPVHPHDKYNFQESSCSAMFGYAISVGIRMKILNTSRFMPVLKKVYEGLKKHGLLVVNKAYLSPALVCAGTCIGDKTYYYKRKLLGGTNFAVGAFILFGLEYERLNSSR